MTATQTMTEHGPSRNLVEEHLRVFHQIVRADPGELHNDELMHQACEELSRVSGSDHRARIEMMRSLIRCMEQRDEMVRAVAKLKDSKPEQCWVLSRPFPLDGRSYVYIMPIGKDASPPGFYEVVEAMRRGRRGTGHRADQREVEGDHHPDNHNGRAPSPPFRGFALSADQLYLGPVDDALPLPPLRGEMFEAVAVCPDSPLKDVAEVEVTTDSSERSFTVFAQPALAREVHRRIEDEGETVRLRVESGVATAIYESNEQKEEDWLEFPPAEGPGIGELVLTASLRQDYARDIRRMVKGRPVQVCLMGPTGCGKTTCAERVGRDALAQARAEGREYRGHCVLRLSSSRIGSSYIHKTERNLFAAIRRARRLAAKGYIVVVLIDEADALLGEMRGGEHTHNRSERLTAQELLSEPSPGVAIYLTLNPRRNSWLPAAIQRRFQRRHHGRACRSQMAAVAEMYVAQRPEALSRLKLTAAEFGAVFADNLFSDRREVAVAHLHSGRRIPIHARDLHHCCPGKAKELIDIFCEEVEDGVTGTIETLWGMIDREFHPVNLNPVNLFDLTFLAPNHLDEVRTVELRR